MYVRSPYILPTTAGTWLDLLPRQSSRNAMCARDPVVPNSEQRYGPADRKYSRGKG